MKEDLKNVIFMGLGAMSLTTEKAIELKQQLLEKGKEAYEKGTEINEELKHNISDKMKEKATSHITKEDITEAIGKMNEKDKKEILTLLKEKKNEK